MDSDFLPRTPVNLYGIVECYLCAEDAQPAPGAPALIQTQLGVNGENSREGTRLQGNRFCKHTYANGAGGYFYWNRNGSMYSRRHNETGVYVTAEGEEKPYDLRKGEQRAANEEAGEARAARAAREILRAAETARELRVAMEARELRAALEAKKIRAAEESREIRAAEESREIYAHEGGVLRAANKAEARVLRAAGGGVRAFDEEAGLSSGWKSPTGV
ncbi:hypothetical protein K488DRAFT_67247 [Vararia minispora EC-137]|uniref:Uncharacterized protein n=1 Tax=Vararia minispora EC-137 TaxID=1314806 RepID=A0ACB8R0F0_9AGAM|nr:hypothetical protein K488DRAFT_67247 [Vararia minispora EC-137]